MIKRKSGNRTRTFQFLKWGLFVPSVLGLLLYVFSVVAVFFSIRGTKSEHTKEDVNNARKWFLYLAIPFYGDSYLTSFLTAHENNTLIKMREVYGKRRYSSVLKMHFPFVGKNMDAFEAYNAKTGNSFEIITV
ncbi:hypothetical protein [Flagellimonas amoyensis]|uniref:hypothetical protein n=1 Tax=Flagellimonas amoyensis TaxID=2169401 RepID=UPI00131EEC48|nr:hypothetical protein [Allomuricauda amoyensis]